MYTQISDPAKMLGVLKEYLSDYNAISKKPMQLVLFQFALEHVSRICRIITSPGMVSQQSLFVFTIVSRTTTIRLMIGLQLSFADCGSLRTDTGQWLQAQVPFA